MEDVVPAFLRRAPAAVEAAAVEAADAEVVCILEPVSSATPGSDDVYLPPCLRVDSLDELDALLAELLPTEGAPAPAAAPSARAPAPYNPVRQVTLAPKGARKALARLDCALHTADGNFDRLLPLVQSLIVGGW